MAEVRDTLNERGGRYGRFDAHAGLAERFIAVAMGEGNWQDMAVVLMPTNWWKLEPDQRHSIRYILDKLARILEGDPDYIDNWHDIAGYATLIEDRLNGTGLYTTRIGKPVVAGEYTMQSSGGTCCKACFAKVGDVHAPDCIHN